MNHFIVFRNTITRSFHSMWDGTSTFDSMTTDSMNTGDTICYVEITRNARATTGRKIITRIGSCSEIIDPINHNKFWIFTIDPLTETIS